MLSRVLKSYANVLHPLEQATAGRQSKEKITWSDELLHHFKEAQDALASNKVITLPQPDDILWIVTDGSVKCHGIGATLYILRNEHLHLAGFFNAKQKNTRLPGFPVKLKHFALVQLLNTSHHT